jgi:hypothetical protein
MKWKFWLTDDLTFDEVQTKAEVSYVAYKKAQAEHKELGEVINELIDYQKMLCPYTKTAYAYEIEYHNPELYTAIQDRIEKIRTLQAEIVI